MEAVKRFMLGIVYVILYVLGSMYFPINTLVSDYFDVSYSRGVSKSKKVVTKASYQVKKMKV